jgi:hypothetical protein
MLQSTEKKELELIFSRIYFFFDFPIDFFFIIITTNKAHRERKWEKYFQMMSTLIKLSFFFLYCGRKIDKLYGCRYRKHINFPLFNVYNATSLAAELQELIIYF